MITDKGKTIIARSLCEQINDPMAYIAVGVGQNHEHVTNKHKLDYNLAFETSRFRVNSTAPFELNKQMAVILNAQMPSVGTYNIWEMGVFTNLQDSLLATNSPKILYTSDNKSVAGTGSFSGDGKAMRRVTASEELLQLSSTGNDLNIPWVGGTRFYGSDSIRLALVVKGQKTDANKYYNLRFFGPVSMTTGSITGGLASGSTNTSGTKLLYKRVVGSWSYMVIDVPIEDVDQDEDFLKISLTAHSTDVEVYVDAIRYESGNHLNGGYAMVSYLKVDTKLPTIPYIKKIDGEEAILTYEMVIGN